MSRKRQKPPSKEIDGAERCPCGSGAIYRRCCKRRSFKWVRSPDGKIAKSVQLSAEAKEIIEDQRAQFIETFGRPPTRYEPVFLATVYMTEAELTRVSLKAMRLAGIRPELAYIFQKTGFAVTDMSGVTPVEEQEIEDAYDEYIRLTKSGKLSGYPGAPSEFQLEIADALKKNQIVLGNLIERYFNKYKNRSAANRDVELVSCLATINVARGIRAALSMIDEDLTYEAFSVARNAYENYLTCAYAYANPNNSKIVMSQFGVTLGTHDYVKSKYNEQIYSKIKNIENGEIVNIPTKAEIARSLGDSTYAIHRGFYHSLSSFVHSDSTHTPLFLTDRGFSYFSPDLSMGVLAAFHAVCILFSKLLSERSPMPGYLRGDMRTIALRSGSNLAMMRRAYVSSGGKNFGRWYDVILDDLATGDDTFAVLLKTIESDLTV